MNEVIRSTSCDSRKAIDRMNEVAARHGGTADVNPEQDLGFLFDRSVADPDSLIWEAMWMNPAVMSAE